MRRPSGETFMTVLIIGGTGFIGRRLIPLLAQRGEESVVMDINPQTANFSELTKVKVLRGDISQFDDVMAVMTSVKPDRVVSRHSAGVEGPITSERSASEPERSHVWPQAAEPTGPHREGEEPKPMMHGHEKSDSAIVAMKPPNKAG